jgi:outer membrane protein
VKQLKTFLAAFSIMIAFLLPSVIQAQDTLGSRLLSLQKAIDLSIKNSEQLKASEARIEEATASLKEARSNKLPNASVSGSYLRLTQPTLNLKSKAFGGNDSSGGGSPNISQAAYGILNVSLPIYTGGRIRYGIESAKYLQEAVMLDEENDKEALILNTINAYINLYKASVTVNVVKQNLLQSLHRDSVLSRLEQNGLLARNDLLKAQLQSSNTELSVLDAENNRKIANVNMNLMLGLPEQAEIIIDSSAFEKPINLKNLEEYEQLALQNRKDILALSFRKKAATSGIAAAKAEMYPSISLTGGYIAADIPHFITITNAITFGVGLQYNIGSLWKTKSKIVQAQAREKEISAGQAVLDDATRLQVNKDYENVVLSQKKTEVYQKAIAQATENYRITKNKYDNNLVNTSDLLDANVALLQSEISLAVAKADVLLAYDRLLQTAGLINSK